MPDPNLPLLEDAANRLAPFLNEIVFVGGATLGLLITDPAAAPIRGTNDIDIIAEIVTYTDYVAFSERLRQAHFAEDPALICRWRHGPLILDVLPLTKEVLHQHLVRTRPAASIGPQAPQRPHHPRHHCAILHGNQDGSLPRPRRVGFPGQPRS